MVSVDAAQRNSRLAANPVCAYQQACEYLHIPASDTLASSLRFTIVSFQYHALGDLQVQSLSVALLVSTLTVYGSKLLITST